MIKEIKISDIEDIKKIKSENKNFSERDLIEITLSKNLNIKISEFIKQLNINKS